MNNDLNLIQCTLCGCNDMIKEDQDIYRCKNCNALYNREDYQKMINFNNDIVNQLSNNLKTEFEENEKKNIGKARQNLFNELNKQLNKDFLSSKDIIKYAKELKNLVSDDVLANFFSLIENPNDLNEYMTKLDYNILQETQKNLIVRFLLRHIDLLKKSSLTSITIPDSVTSISDESFKGCSSLTSIIIPNSVTSIGYRAFYGCSSLVYNKYDNAYYLGNETNKYLVLIKSTSTSITNCNISEGCKFIYSEAFSDCSNLTNIIIPDSVTSIGRNAFENCSSLTSITISNNVISIGDEAFSDCSNLINITIPDNVKSIGDETFYGCSSLVYNKYNNAYYLGNEINKYLVLVKSISTSITNCNISEGCKFIYSNAFSNCSNLTNITIPDSVINIGYETFSDCSSLTNIIISNNITSICYELFKGCSSLASITIPNSITSIGNEAFSGCSNLTSIVIPDSVTSINSWAFYNCRSLRSITIPNSVTNIGDEAFSDCSSLTSITIPSSVTNINSLAFENCSSLTSIIIPDSVISIGNNVFKGCSGLVYNKYDNAYYLGNETNKYLVLMKSTSTSITNCNISEGCKFICSEAFYDCSSLTSITIPDSVKSIGNEAFSNCNNLTSITMPNNVTNIDSWAFYNCSSLTSINFSGTKSQWAKIYKGSSWNSYTGKYTIYCTDGVINKT